jgi:sec-independent protein translocase protein TatB
MQRYVNDVKADIAREMELDELKKLQAQMQDAARTFEHSVTREINATESELQKLAQEANPIPPPPSETKAAPPATDPADIAAPVLESPTAATPSDVAPASPASTPHAAATESELAGGTSQPTNTRV